MLLVMQDFAGPSTVSQFIAWEKLLRAICLEKLEKRVRDVSTWVEYQHN